jgi:hypothetical protein
MLLTKKEKSNKIKKGWKERKEWLSSLSDKQRKKYLINYPRNLSIEHKKKLRECMKGRFVGNLNNNWKGGITPLIQKIRFCFEYRQWRSDIFTRDNFTCQECEYNKGGNLEAHHIKPFSKIIEKYNIKTLEEAKVCEELWDINNGITLCKKCHKKTYRFKA